MGRFLLVAPNGMLGRAWKELLAARGLDADLAPRGVIDLAAPETIETGVRPGYSAVVNCAAWTDVDGAEAHEADATRVNGDGVGVLARRCATIGATLIHYGTDYVFDGRGTAPYPIDAPYAPLNAYGRSKAAGEHALTSSGGRHLLVRTSWVYAPWGKNFVRTIAKAAAERESLRVVNDQHGRPTSAEHLAAVSLALLDAEGTGTFHVGDGGECTWFDLAREIAAFVRPACRVDPCTTAEFPRPAPRPSYSVLDVSRAEAIVGPFPHWTANVREVLSRLE
jgi:dTDP-4-dehydrorhamnose reductase